MLLMLYHVVKEIRSIIYDRSVIRPRKLMNFTATRMLLFELLPFNSTASVIDLLVLTTRLLRMLKIGCH